MNDPFNFRASTYERVDQPFFGLLVQIGCVGLKRANLLLGFVLSFWNTFPWYLRLFTFFTHTMSDEINNIDAINILLLQQKHGMAFLFAKDRDQYVGTIDLFFATGLHVKD